MTSQDTQKAEIAANSGAPVLSDRVASWHGEQSAKAYCKWQRTNDDADLRDFTRHAGIADRMWSTAPLAGAK